MTLTYWLDVQHYVLPSSFVVVFIDGTPQVSILFTAVDKLARELVSELNVVVATTPLPLLTHVRGEVGVVDEEVVVGVGVQQVVFLHTLACLSELGVFEKRMSV